MHDHVASAARGWMFLCVAADSSEVARRRILITLQRLSGLARCPCLIPEGLIIVGPLPGVAAHPSGRDVPAALPTVVTTAVMPASNGVTNDPSGSSTVF